ncbi:MAG: F-type H+-transporting ATPase subunit b [Psychromonas sp.]|jgi:F-type H+-transporting ATPase subunit b|uniref:F0F1 ATP synthase subunit B family protein n=1 Tax=Psychromonas sp. TaxID=1884585 RepID=UPI0039E700B9
MLIDWFTVVAQAINFLVLVWLLKRFLYRPILDAIDAREQRIAKTLSDAADKEKQAQQERDLFLHKNNQLDLQSEKLLQTATTAANTEAQRLLGKARQVAEDLCVQQQATFQKQQHSLSAELTKKTQQEVFAITRKALKDLADSGLEEQILSVFLNQLDELDENSKASFIAALSKKNTVLVRTTFALPSAQQHDLSKALTDSFATKLNIRFETDPDVVSGIELYIDGQKLAWSIAQYINSLEQHFQQLVRQSARHLGGKLNCADELSVAESTALSTQVSEEKRSTADD